MKITYLHRCKKEVPKQMALASANGGYFAVRLYPVCLIDGKWNEEESALCPACMIDLIRDDAQKAD